MIVGQAYTPDWLKVGYESTRYLQLAYILWFGSNMLLQVLPHRTHPMMQMSGTGGYTLSGYKIKSSYLAPIPAAASAAEVETLEEPEAKRVKVDEPQAQATVSE